MIERCHFPNRHFQKIPFPYLHSLEYLPPYQNLPNVPHIWAFHHRFDKGMKMLGKRKKGIEIDVLKGDFIFFLLQFTKCLREA